MTQHVGPPTRNLLVRYRQRTKKALVTGSNGFIGSHLVEELLLANYEVSCLVRKTSNLQWIEELPVKLYYGDYNYPSSVIKAVEAQDYVFHVAGIVKAKTKDLYYKVNTEYTRVLIDITKRYNSNLQKFVFVSSHSASGQTQGKWKKRESEPDYPISHYGMSKKSAEMLVQKITDFPWTIIRPTSVYGPRDIEVFQYFKMVNMHLAPIVGTKRKYFSLIYIKDLVRLIRLSAENSNADGKIFFACDDNIYTWQDFISALKQVMNKSEGSFGKVLSIIVPDFLLYPIAIWNEFRSLLSSKVSLLNIERIKEIKGRYWLCTSKQAEKLLNFTPRYTLLKGLEETYKWYKEHKWL